MVLSRLDAAGAGDTGHAWRRPRMPPAFVCASRAPGAERPEAVRVVASAAPPAPAPRRAARGTGDRQVTIGRDRRARSVVEGWGGREVRQVAAVSGGGVRHRVRCPQGDARQQQRKVRRRSGGKPAGRPQRNDAAVGRAIDGRQPRGSRRAKRFVVRPRCPQSRRRRRVGAGTVGSARRLGARYMNARDARWPVTGLPEGCRWAKRRQYVDDGEPEGGEQKHEGKITGPEFPKPPAVRRAAARRARRPSRGRPRSRGRCSAGRAARAAARWRGGRRPPPRSRRSR